MKTLKNMNFLIPEYYIRKVVDSLELENILRDWKKSSIYEIDGLVISSDKNFKRETSGNPKYSVAFKVNSEGVTTTVEEVIWNPSKYGILVPKVRIKPVIIDGDTITYASASNAKFIEENRIGKGTILKIVKSGDVIPYINKIIKRTGPDFPNLKYYWNETEVNIILDEKDTEIEIKRLLSFIQTIGIENLSIGIVTKLFDSGFDTPRKIYEMTIEDFKTLPGVKEKSSQKLYNSIHCVLDNHIQLGRIMAASLVFGNGFGEKRLSLVTESYPDILDPLPWGCSLQTTLLAEDSF